MSYAKLFGSILDSTIWLEDLHVKVVWVTMLAMKDRDGIVEASVPGLAKRAGVTLAQVQDALTILLAPDVHSRTPDHEGRRIETIDGGWVVLNHEKYRDREDAEERRAKNAARVARHRERKKLRGSAPPPPPDVMLGNACNVTETPVTLGNSPKPHAETEAESSGMGARDPDPDPGSGSAPSGASGQGLPGDRVQAAAQERPASRRSERGGVRPDPEALARGALVARFVELVNAARARVAEAHGLADVRPLAPLVSTSTEHTRELRARLETARDPAADMAHVIAVAEAEAMADPRDLRWLQWSLAREGAWNAKLASTLTASAPKEESAFDFIDRRGAERDARRARGES